MPCIILILIWATSFAFYRYAYNIYIFCSMKHVVSKITRNELTYDQLALVKNLKRYSILDKVILI